MICETSFKIYYKKLIFCLLIGLFSYSNHAYIPEPSLILRQYPAVLKSQKSYNEKGSLFFLNKTHNKPQKFNYSLSWQGSDSYKVLLSHLPPDFFNQSNARQVLIHRTPSTCTLETNFAKFNCYKSSIWAKYSFSTNINSIFNQLINENFANKSDTIAKQVNSKTYTLDNKNRLSFKLNINNKKPKAVIELQSPQLKSFSKLKYPVIQFESMQYKPIMVRYHHEGDLITIKGHLKNPGTRIKRYQAFQYDTVNLYKGTEHILKVIRGSRASGASYLPSLISSSSKQSFSDLNNYLDPQGRDFLTGILQLF